MKPFNITSARGSVTIEISKRRFTIDEYDKAMSFWEQEVYSYKQGLLDALAFKSREPERPMIKWYAILNKRGATALYSHVGEFLLKNGSKFEISVSDSENKLYVGTVLLGELGINERERKDGSIKVMFLDARLEGTGELKLQKT